MKPLIAVTGRKGQLGSEIELLSSAYGHLYDFVFTGKEELDLSQTRDIPSFFEKYRPAYFINCAAYTAVDRAETDQETAYVINAEATGIIAGQCRQYNCTLITISTDYVFDGNAKQPYMPDHPTEPGTYYGYTKQLGEKLALENNTKTVIVRTSWMYSSFGHNFVKTMLRLMKEREEISVVLDQLGSPTYAADLAAALLQMVVAFEHGNTCYGIYHYSNSGATTWYDFAVTIRDISGLHCRISPIGTADYPTPAKRPAYSVMDTTAIQRDFGVISVDWVTALKTCLQKLVQGIDAGQ